MIKTSPLHSVTVSAQNHSQTRVHIAGVTGPLEQQLSVFGGVWQFDVDDIAGGIKKNFCVTSVAENIYARVVPVIPTEADQPHADEWSAEHRKAHENCKAHGKDQRANWEGKRMCNFERCRNGK
jgi:hypothetical protein